MSVDVDVLKKNAIFHMIFDPKIHIPLFYSKNMVKYRQMVAYAERVKKAVFSGFCVYGYRNTTERETSQKRQK